MRETPNLSRNSVLIEPLEGGDYRDRDRDRSPRGYSDRDLSLIHI